MLMTLMITVMMMIKMHCVDHEDNYEVANDADDVAKLGCEGGGEEGESVAREYYHDTAVTTTTCDDKSTVQYMAPKMAPPLAPGFGTVSSLSKIWRKR